MEFCLLAQQAIINRILIEITKLKHIKRGINESIIMDTQRVCSMQLNISNISDGFDIQIGICIVYLSKTLRM